MEEERDTVGAWCPCWLLGRGYTMWLMTLELWPMLGVLLILYVLCRLLR